MHPVVVKSCGHRMWSLVVSICDVTGGRYYSAASVIMVNKCVAAGCS